MIVAFLFGVIILIYSWMSPFIPYIMAKLMKKDILIVFQKNGQIKLIPSKYESGVYTVDSESTPWTFLKKDSSLLRFGDVPACLCIDSWAITINPKLILAIQELYKFGIANFERLDDKLNMEHIEITNAYKESRAVNNDIVTLSGRELMCNSFDIINFNSVIDFASDISPTQLTAAIRDEIAKRIELYKTSNIVEPKSDFNWTMLLIIGGLVLVGVVGMKSMGYI